MNGRVRVGVVTGRWTNVAKDVRTAFCSVEEIRRITLQMKKKVIFQNEVSTHEETLTRPLAHSRSRR